MAKSNQLKLKQPKKVTTILDLIATVHRLRAPGGCPWDRAQTHQSLRQYLIEEAYEVLDVLDKIKTAKDLKAKETSKPFIEELGDLLMQILIHSEMANEQGVFNFFDVAKALNNKLIYRHPHVFGDIKANSPAGALKNWEKQKAKEKAEQAKIAGASAGGGVNSGHKGLLSGLPKALPALQRTARVIEKVTRVGFQWKGWDGPLDKLDEEISELKAEIRAQSKTKNKTKNNAKTNERVEAEMGDVLFSICNIAFLAGINPEDALRGTLERFEGRFSHVESSLMKKGKRPEDSTLKEMDKYWNEAKLLEKK